MKRGPEYSDSQRKKLVGEHLRNADKLLKSGEYDQALAEVEQSLTLEPGNFYAQAYKERITSLREKHAKPGDRPAAPPPRPSTPGSGLAAEPPSSPAPSPEDELSAATGARIEEVPHDEPAGDEAAAAAGDSFAPGRGVEELKERLERQRATQEDEARRQAEQLARQSIEGEMREREESERMRVTEQEALAAVIEAAPADALALVVDRAADAFGRSIDAGDLDGAFRELSAIGIVDPGNPRIAELTARLEAATHAAATAAHPNARTVPRDIPLQWYGRLLRSAWSEGTPNRTQAEAVSEAKKRFGVSEEEERGLLDGIRREIVAEAVKQAYAEGEPDAEVNGFLETLARELSVGDLEALRASVRK